MTTSKLDPALPWKVRTSVGGKLLGQYSSAANADLDAKLQREACVVVFDRRFDLNDGAVLAPDGEAYRAGYLAALADTKEILKRNELRRNER
jgi:hypothetical protein